MRTSSSAQAQAPRPPPTSAGQLFRVSPEGGGSRGWNECGIHYWGLAMRGPHFLPGGRRGDGGGEALGWSHGELGWGLSGQSPCPSPHGRVGGLPLPCPWAPLALRTWGWGHVPLLPWLLLEGKARPPWPLPPTASCFAASAASLAEAGVGVGRSHFRAAALVREAAEVC